MKLLHRFIEEENRWALAKRYFKYRTPVGYELVKYKYRHMPNVVFIWIPKTAGTSIFSWLNQNIDMVKLKKMKDIKTFRNAGPVTFGHYNYSLLLKEGYISKYFDKDAYKFCITRNPFDRVVSLYYYLLKIKRFQTDNKTPEFSKFLSRIHEDRCPVGLYHTRNLSQGNPQVDWITNESGDLIVEEIFRFEELDVFRASIAERFNLNIEKSIPQENRSERQENLETLLRQNSENIPLIKAIYREDFERLGYDINEYD